MEVFKLEGGALGEGALGRGRVGRGGGLIIFSSFPHHLFLLPWHLYHLFFIFIIIIIFIIFPSCIFFSHHINVVIIRRVNVIFEVLPKQP